jgi:hypothetical protein
VRPSPSPRGLPARQPLPAFYPHINVLWIKLFRSRRALSAAASIIPLPRSGSYTKISSNYDPTGNNTQGRVTVVFRGNWAQAADIARTNVQGIELVEVA